MVIKVEQLIEQAIKQAGYKKWTVYAKAPFNKFIQPAQVLQSRLGRDASFLFTPVTIIETS